MKKASDKTTLLGISKTKFLLICASIMFLAALVIALLSLFGWLAINLETRTFQASVNVSSDRGGFDLNSTALTFGKIRLGGSSTRNVVFQNDYGFPVVLRISSKGNIMPLLTYENNVQVGTGETKKLSFSAVSDNSTALGFYSGQVKVKILRAR